MKRVARTARSTTRTRTWHMGSWTEDWMADNEGPPILEREALAGGSTGLSSSG